MKLFTEPVPITSKCSLLKQAEDKNLVLPGKRLLQWRYTEPSSATY